MDIILQIFKRDSDKSFDTSKSFFVLQDTKFGQSQGNLDQVTLPRSVWFLYKYYIKINPSFQYFSYTDSNDELPVNSLKRMGISDNPFSK